jgi:hypothetical protein
VVGGTWYVDPVESETSEEIWGFGADNRHLRSRTPRQNSSIAHSLSRVLRDQVPIPRVYSAARAAITSSGTS